MHNEKLNQKEDSIHSDHQSVFNDSVTTESVSDIAEEKDDECCPEDLSINSVSLVSPRDNQKYV